MRSIPDKIPDVNIPVIGDVVNQGKNILKGAINVGSLVAKPLTWLADRFNGSGTKGGRVHHIIISHPLHSAMSARGREYLYNAINKSPMSVPDAMHLFTRTIHNDLISNRGSGLWNDVKDTFKKHVGVLKDKGVKGLLEHGTTALDKLKDTGIISDR